MGTYVVTGAASGMGHAVAEKLRSAGHTVVDVDIKESTITADLSTAQGRAFAAQAVLELADGRIDGAVLAAGLGPAPGKDRPRLIAQVNYFGVTDLLTAWRPALAAAERAKVVVFSSNSTTTTPGVPNRAIQALLDNDLERTLRSVAKYESMAPALTYAASKIALSRWVRREAVTRAWAGAGIRLNAIAPGAVLTPLLEQQLATTAEERAIRAFPVPVGGFGDAQHLADWVMFMLSDAADFLCGSVIFVDGGSDAYFRADDWPRQVPRADIPRYLTRMRSFTQRPAPDRPARHGESHV